MSRKDKRENRPSGPSGSPERRTEAFRIDRDDREPVAENRPVPVLLVAALVALFFWADMYVMRNGADVGGAGGAFSAKVYFPYTRYDQLPQPGGDPLVGRKMYEQNCSLCHQPTGLGNPAQSIPPLAGSDWVLEEGPNRVIKLILNGIQGPITVNGKPFNGTMPPWRDVMTDEQIAAVATYIRSTWGNKAPPVKPEEVKAQRDTTAARTSAWSPDELLQQPTK